jgi:hypothetical protein
LGPGFVGLASAGIARDPDAAGVEKRAGGEAVFLKDGVDQETIEARGFGGVLLRDVDGGIGFTGGAEHNGGVAQIAAHSLGAGGIQFGGRFRRSGERNHVAPEIAQSFGHDATDIAGSAGDEDLHGSIVAYPTRALRCAGVRVSLRAGFRSAMALRRFT